MKIRTCSDYCKEKFGCKVYRISLTTGCSCPNRDGTVGYGGCSFCSEVGSGEFTKPKNSILEEIEEAKALVIHKFPKNIRMEDRKFIAYFQSFSNTYGDTAKLRKIFMAVAMREEIVALSIATRPDCIDDEKLSMLLEIQKIKPIWMELGLQTIHEKCAQRFNRGYHLSAFEDTYHRLKRKGFEVIVHVILGLPYETSSDSIKTIEYLAELKPGLDGIKLHLLHILRGTKMALEYEKNPFPIYTLEEYSDLVVDCLKRLPESIVVHRLTGDGDKRKLMTPLWSADKKRVLNVINAKILEANREQL